MIARFKKKNTGFTLIELMITVVLASVVISLGVPSFQALLRNNHLSTATNNFISSINVARSEAIKRREKISVTATNSSESANEWGKGGWTIKVVDGGEVLKTIPAIQGIDITMNSTTGIVEFEYSADGSVDNPDTLNVCAAGFASGRQITIITTGRVSVNSDYNSCPES